MESKPKIATKPLNYVHKGIIHAENIGKERKFETKNFKYEYTFSPYTCKIKFHLKFTFSFFSDFLRN
jgi:hypothetical protein